MTMRGPNKPTRIPVDELRRRTWLALKAAQPRRTGTMPAVDHVFQAVYVLGNAGLDTKATAVALGVSDNYVRVARRNNAKKLMPTVETEGSTENAKRSTAAERKLLANIPCLSWPIEKLHAVLQQIPSPSEAWAHDPEMLAALRRAGLNV